jgi:hypothetical protein
MSCRHHRRWCFPGQCWIAADASRERERITGPLPFYDVSTRSRCGFRQIFVNDLVSIVTHRSASTGTTLRVPGLNPDNSKLRYVR